MKIVLDTAILVRANGHTKGLARELLLLLIESKHHLLLSNEMLFELAKVLRYPRLQAIYNLSEELVFEYSQFLRKFSEIVILDPLVAAPIRDANDVIVMQTAIIGEADILCTNDGDFFDTPALQFLTHLGIDVLDDVGLMQRLRRQSLPPGSPITPMT